MPNISPMKHLFTVLLFSLVLGVQILSAQTVKIGTTTYPTIPDAITAAMDGDVIEITGVHTGNFSIVDKSITLKGTDPKVDILQAAASQAAATGRVIYVNNSSPSTLAGINVTIENLGIRYGNISAANGGGIFADKLKGTDPLKGKITLRNLIVEQNTTGTNGGGIAISGTDADIIESTISSNSATASGAGIIAAGNGVINSITKVNIIRSLITGNTAVNGGGLYINGTANTTYTMEVSIENSTISTNVASSTSTSAVGGGGIWSQAAASDNVTLKMVHVTMYNNDHAGTATRNGIAFGTTAGSLTNFSVYNSIIVTADATTENAINFAQSTTTDVVNSILGGTNLPPTLIDDVTKNNVRGRTATQAGIATTLTDEGGKVKVLKLGATASAANYCTANTGITLPTTDARGQTRDLKPDAGAFEIPNTTPTVSNAVADQSINTGTASLDVDLTNTFNDADADVLALTASSGNTNIVTTSITGSILTITAVNPGTTTITVTANDGRGGTVNDQFSVTVNSPPIVATPITDKTLAGGFGTSAIDLTNVFSDTNSDVLALSVVVANTSVVTAAISGTTLTLTEVSAGTTTITVTANDGKGGTVSDEFSVVINSQPVVSAAITDKIVNAGFGTTTINLSSVFSDADADALTLSVTVANTAIVTGAISGTTLTLSEVGTGTTTVTVTANDGKGGTVSDDFSVTVNSQPVVSVAITDKSLAVGFGTTTINLAAVFSDADADVLSLSVTVANTAIVTAAISGTTLTLTEVGTGSTTVTITANDGKGGTVSDEFTVSVSSGLVNDPPTVASPIADRTLAVGFVTSTVNLSTVFSDANADVLTLSVTSSDVNVVTTAISGTTLTLTEVGRGTSTITVTANDGKGGSVQDAFTVLVNALPVVATPIADQALTVGFGTTTINLSNVFSDADADVLSLSVTVANTAIVTAAISGTTLTLTEVGTGTTTVTVTANDGKGGSVADQFNVNVNALPTVASPIADRTLTVGFGTNTVNLSTVFSDANADPLTLSVTSSNVNVVTAAISGTTLTLTEVGRGTSTITVTANDGKGGSVSDQFTVLVNAPPTVATPIADQSLTTGFGTRTISLANVFSDADADPLTLSITVANTAIVTAAISGTTLTLTEVGTGSTTVTVTANDGKGGSVADQFSVNVNAPPTVASAIPDRTLALGFGTSTVNLSAVFSDANSDVLTLSVTSSDVNVVTAAISGTTLTLTEVGRGTSNITVTANDGKGGSVSDQFTVVVNAPPTVTAPIADQSLTTGFGTKTISLSNVFSDLDADPLTLSATVANQTIVTAAITGTALTLTEVAAGSTTVTVTANDGKGGTVSDQFAVTVTTPGNSVKIGTITYPTIADAVTAAADGAIIEIRGIYTERLNIGKSVTLRGADPLLDKVQAASTPGTAAGGVITIAKPTGSTATINVTIENLGIRHGNAPTAINGGGIFADKLSGKLILRNLIIEQNRTANNGGGVALAGTDADIIDCTIINNTATSNGGGIIAATNNAAGMNNKVNIIRSLIDSNTALNGGGLYVNGNPGAPNTYSIEVNIENTTISNNIANSASSLAGGGGIWSQAATSSNVTLRMVHVTMYNNDHSTTATRNGISFGTTAGSLTNFSLYNSIIVTADVVTEAALNFANSNTTDVVNSIIGGTNLPPTLLDDVAKNNVRGRTATQAGIATTLTDQGGKVKVLAITEGVSSVDYCTAAVSITLPTTDATGKTRDAKPDAGAFEFVKRNSPPTVSTPVPDQFVNINSATAQVDLSKTFADPDGDNLSLRAVIANSGIATISITGTTLIITPVAVGSTNVTVTADDGKGGTVTDAFTVSIQNNNAPTVANAVPDRIFQVGFANATIDLSNTFRDADNDALTLSVAVSNQNVIRASLSGTTLTITEVGRGNANVTVTANDGNGATVSDVFSVTVNAAPVVSNAIPDQELIKGFGASTLNLANVFSDPNGDALTLTVAVANPDVIKASISGTTLTFTETGVGKTTITVTANDGKGGTVADDFSVLLLIVLAAEDETSMISLYPNPAASRMKINTDVREVIIIDTNGIGNTYEVKNGEVDISTLSNGVYMLYISSLNKRIRFVKQ